MDGWETKRPDTFGDLQAVQWAWGTPSTGRLARRGAWIVRSFTHIVKESPLINSGGSQV